MLSELENVRFTTPQARLLLKINEDQQSKLATKADINNLKNQITNLDFKIDNVNDKIDNVEDKLSSQITNLDFKIDNVNDKIDNVEDKLSSQITNLDFKIDNVEDKLSSQITNLDFKIDNVNDKIDNVEDKLTGQIENVRGEIKNVEDKIKNIEDKIENVEDKIENVRDELSAVQSDVIKIKANLSNTATKDELAQLGDSLKVLITASGNKTRYDVIKWVVGAVVANGIIATIVSFFSWYLGAVAVCHAELDSVSRGHLNRDYCDWYKDYNNRKDSKIIVLIVVRRREIAGRGPQWRIENLLMIKY